MSNSNIQKTDRELLLEIHQKIVCATTKQVVAQHQSGGGVPPIARTVIWVSPSNLEERSLLNRMAEVLPYCGWTGIDSEMLIIAIPDDAKPKE